MWNLINTTNKIETNSLIQRTDWQLGRGLSKTGEGIKQKNPPETKIQPHRHRQNRVITRGKGGGGGRRG